ncbi:MULTISPECIES: hypothetical protein [unclassified Okeania]|uniref:hypothetical protein n=1 Tax=unclassified Okeania TaxID=2634635 RepID=UPI0013B93686|nr:MULTISPECIES: hypothetical protein [unclassified Okeania]NET12836.1 hypothetical protein [Okeania sp. SIO1H6]NES77764.1 hypothetical protein [Okeania sp. SIO1H4]NET19460.1 hypothetical protein [Okeania sp. SIO1H5]NET76587.1 hypothetical protein [Okeania sp. SIO1F9]NET94181.1 hypothetical protein [Okeania sp. SIO1H2]
MPDSSNRIDKSKKLQRYSFSTEVCIYLLYNSFEMFNRLTKAIALGNGILLTQRVN